MHPILASANINLASSWSTFWAAISGSLGKITTVLAVVGMLLVVVAVVSYIWEKRRGGESKMGGGHTKVLWTLGFGMVLAAPNVVIPAILTLADFVANAIASALSI